MELGGWEGWEEKEMGKGKTWSENILRTSNKKWKQLKGKIISFIFWDFNIIISFPWLMSFHETLPYAPRSSPSNSSPTLTVSHIYMRYIWDYIYSQIHPGQSYGITCMYVSSAEHLVLDNQLVYLSLGKTVSPILNTPCFSKTELWSTASQESHYESTTWESPSLNRGV